MENKVNDMPTATDKELLSKAKDIVAQRNDYADWIQIDMTEHDQCEKNETKALFLDDVAKEYSDLKCKALLERIKELEYDYNALNETLIGRINELEYELKEMTLDRDSASQAWSQEHGYHLELQESADKLAEAIEKEDFISVTTRKALTNYRKLKEKC